jgi:transposase-like protein
MDHAAFRAWLSEVDGLTLKQRAELQATLSERPPSVAVAGVVEERLGEERRCPHCGNAETVSRGQVDGLRRFRCKGCSKSFNALTGTPLARLRKKGLWLEFGQSLSEGETVAASAERCGVAPSTAFRWRHRFLRAAETAAKRLGGIVEVDETYILSSCKGERGLTREPRRRGGKAGQRGLSKEQTAILVAADRSGATLSAILPEVTAKAIGQVLEPVLERDALLVSDANNVYPPCARALGVSHESLNHSDGQRVRGELHIQTVNSRHEGIKTFLRPRRGIATRYLPSYLRWFHLIALHQAPTARACLNAALGSLPRVAVLT